MGECCLFGLCDFLFSLFWLSFILGSGSAMIFMEAYFSFCNCWRCCWKGYKRILSLGYWWGLPLVFAMFCFSRQLYWQLRWGFKLAYSYCLIWSGILNDGMSNSGKKFELLYELLGSLYFSGKVGRLDWLRRLLNYLFELINSVMLILLVKSFCRFLNGGTYASYKVWILFFVPFFVLFCVNFCRRTELKGFKIRWLLLFWVLLLYSPISLER
ncbi:uncharacterized protein LOC114580755 [Dendrobium catenatum]|uniref:uncharacterized protein LOC114580755 n=1 Tax=Dendrobium catenatum TaxID=906689 RepID=UPI00109FD262|nr:uncharacterized protein LOC114580755 [Dendrobium catenatum]